MEQGLRTYVVGAPQVEPDTYHFFYRVPWHEMGTRGKLDLSGQRRVSRAIAGHSVTYELYQAGDFESAFHLSTTFERSRRLVKGSKIEVSLAAGGLPLVELGPTNQILYIP